MLLIFVSSTNYIQIVRRQCCLFFSFLPENASQWVFFADQGHCSHLRLLAILGKVALSSFLSPCHVSALPLFSEGRPCFFYQLPHICLIFVFVSQRVRFLFPNDTFSTSPLARRSGGWINLLPCQVKSHLATTCSRPRWRPADCSAATGLETRPFPEPSQVLRRYPPVSGTGLESYAD